MGQRQVECKVLKGDYEDKKLWLPVLYALYRKMYLLYYSVLLVLNMGGFVFDGKVHLKMPLFTHPQDGETLDKKREI